jgi:hypothetical protein
MKLRYLRPDTKTEEVYEYLKKRHPLYFMGGKISEEQTVDLINRLKYKLKQMQAMSGATASSDVTKKENSVPS